MEEFRKKLILRRYESLKMQLGLSKAEELVSINYDSNGKKGFCLASTSPTVVLYYARHIVSIHKSRLDGQY